MAEKIYVNVALSNADTCVCCDENGTTVDCCVIGADFGGMYHPDGIKAAQVWAAEHIDLMRTLTNQVSECCAGKCQVSTQEAIPVNSEFVAVAPPTSSLLEEPNDTDTNTQTIIVDLPLDGSLVTVNGDGTVQAAESDDLVVVEIPEGVVTKSGNLSDPELSDEPEAEFPNGDGLLRKAGLPESCLDELMGAGLDTPEKVLAHEDLSQIKGIGIKTRDKILRILNEGE